MKFSSLKSQTSRFLSSITGASRTKKDTSQNSISDQNQKSPPQSSHSGISLSWLKIFFLSLSGLVLLGISLWMFNTIEALFARHPLLGAFGAGLVALSILALIMLSGRELMALIRLKRVTTLRHKAEDAIENEDDITKEYVITQTQTLYLHRKELEKPFDRLAEKNFEELNTSERLSEFESEIFSPLDKRAKHIISDAAKRVSMLTAVSPFTALDVAFVCWQNLRMLHKLASVYSGRPGSFETLRLAKMVLSHLALTGGIAMGDNLLQNLLGRGIAAKVSTRLGEGLANGILTSRVGLAALDLCRPLPFINEKKPSLKSLIGPLISINPQENFAA